MRALLVALVPVVARAARRVLGAGSPRRSTMSGSRPWRRCVRRLASFRGESSVTHFAERIAVYRALSARRDAGARRRLAEEAAPGRGVRAAGRGRSEPARAGLLLEALDTLSPEQAEALTLHFFFDHTVPEIAAMTGVPPETVRSRLRLGKQALRARIQKDERLSALREEWQ